MLYLLAMPISESAEDILYQLAVDVICDKRASRACDALAAHACMLGVAVPSEKNTGRRSNFGSVVAQRRALAREPCSEARRAIFGG